MARTERTPEAITTIPVFVPGEGGRVTQHEMGYADMRHGRLNIQFKDNLPAVAIQRMIARGEIVGVSFVMLSPTEEEASEPEGEAAEEGE